MRKPLFARSGFTMTEIVMALGIAAFCLIGIFGLLSVGLQSSQSSSEQTAVAQVMTAIVADLQSTRPLTTATSVVFKVQLPVAGSNQSPQYLFFAQDGSISANKSDARYLATVEVTPPAANQKTATAVRILLTWPAGADASITQGWPTHYTGCVETFSALDRN
jgi:uncharacterized protein (TIGR02598 family)